MAKVWLFRSHTGGTGQTTLVLQLAVAAARKELKAVALSDANDLSVIARHFPESSENFKARSLRVSEVETAMQEARSSADIVLIDAKFQSTLDLDLHDQEVMIVNPTPVSIESARQAIEDRAERLAVIANRMPTEYHGQLFSKNFIELCGSTCSKQVDVLGSIPDSVVLSWAGNLGAPYPRRLSWTPTSKALNEMVEKMKDFGGAAAGIEPFDLATLRSQMDQEAA